MKWPEDRMMYQRQMAEVWWRAQTGLGWLGSGGLLSSQRQQHYGDQFFSSLPPQFVNQELVGSGSRWKDLIRQAINIAEGESAYAKRQIMGLAVGNNCLWAIVEKPDWCEAYEKWAEKQ